MAGLRRARHPRSRMAARPLIPRGLGCIQTLVSIDSTTARAHHDAAGMHLGEDVVTALEKAAAEEEKARSKGAASKSKTGKRPKMIPCWKNDASGVGGNSG